MIEKIKLYIFKGKLKLALESLLQAAEELKMNEIQNSAIINISRLVSTENKLLQGVIDFEKAELVENQIRVSTLSLIESFEQNLQSSQSQVSQKKTSLKPVNPTHSIIGKWYCEFYDPDSNSYKKLFWEIKSDNSFLVEFYTMDDVFNSRVRGLWKMEDNIYTELYPKGGEGKGLIEWVNQDKIIFTVLTGQSKKHTNLKKIYTRVKPDGS